jgi:hypothetical protein
MIQENLLRRGGVRVGSSKRILARLFRWRYDPGSFLERGKANGDKNQSDSAGKKDFAHLEAPLLVRAHTLGKIFAQIGHG